MSKRRLKLYMQLQDAKRTKTIKKVMNRLRADLYADIRRQVAHAVEIGRVTGFDEVIDEMHRAIDVMKVEKKY